jgi:hypothetical protein
MRKLTYRYNQITYKVRFSDKSHYLLAMYGTLHSITLQPLCVIFSKSNQTANIFATVQFAALRNSCDNPVRNVNMVAVRIVYLGINFVSKTEKD